MHLIHAFIHSFIHQLFIEPPLGAKHHSEKAAQIRAPAPVELTSQKSAGFTTLETEDCGHAPSRGPVALHLAKRHEIVLDVGTSDALWLVTVVGDHHCDCWVEAADAGDECP